MTIYNRGFVALFFTLGVSSILLTYVSLSSTNLFRFIRAREDFKGVRATIQNTLQCADQYVNALVRTYSVPSLCNATNKQLTRTGPDTLIFSFKINTITFTGTIQNGRISELGSY